MIQSDCQFDRLLNQTDSMIEENKVLLRVVLMQPILRDSIYLRVIHVRQAACLSHSQKQWKRLVLVEIHIKEFVLAALPPFAVR
jgi:hypothetical protein